MPDNIKYVISKVEDGKRFYLCPREEECQWEGENLFNAVKFSSANQARSYADGLSNAVVQAVIWEDDVGCFGGYKLEKNLASE